MSLRRRLLRLRRLDRDEITWRLRTTARRATDRARARLIRPRWRRDDLAPVLDPSVAGVAPIVALLTSNRLLDAHAAWQRHFVERPRRFILHPSSRIALTSAVLAEHPESAAQARADGERVGVGRLDLLGYQGVQVQRAGVGIDWHFDPVSGRRCPQVFWADVPYLDPRNGDHKVIWELNRHQHWLLLGRSYWLTGDESARQAFMGELDSWLAANPPLRGVNWASALELAFRSLSWIWALEFFATVGARDEPPWTVDLLLGLHVQLDHIERNLSTYFSPNTHLLGEALALYVCGLVLPELRGSTRWAATGRGVLLAEATRQVLPDGAHAERSAHYHRYALDFYLLALAVARTCGDPAADHLAPVAARMAGFLRDIVSPSGELPLVGDDDGGELVPLAGRAPQDARSTLAWAAALLDTPSFRLHPVPETGTWLTALVPDATPVAPSLAHRAVASAVAGPSSTLVGLSAPLTSTIYPQAGCVILRHGDSKLMLDVGEHGFLNGGHAHADALSVSAVVGRHWLLIDPGTGTYTMDPVLRDRFRSTQAHNTVTLDGRSQSRPDGPFHWASVASGATERVEVGSGFDYVEAHTDAYAPARHERRLFVTDDERWIVTDRVIGGGRHHAAVHWHLHPAWTAAPAGASAVRLTHETGLTARLAVPGRTLECFRGDSHDGLGWMAPVYGRIVPTTTLRAVSEGMAPLAFVTVIDSVNSMDIASTALLDVLSPGEASPGLAVATSRGTALEITVFGTQAAPQLVTIVVDARRHLVITTDARALHARIDADGLLTRACLVDARILRYDGAHSVTVSSVDTIQTADVRVEGANAWLASGAAVGHQPQIDVRPLPTRGGHRARPGEGTAAAAAS